jgi:SNF2 family DNA or RNA helicase
LKARGFKFVLYHGSMRIEQREEALNKIKNNEAYTIICVSLKCGSLGLNLTACSRVILAGTFMHHSAS